MSKLNVAVLFGGVSVEHEVSNTSALNIISNMSTEKYNVIPIYISAQGKWMLYDGKIGDIRNIDIEKFGTPTILSPDSTHKGLLRLMNNKFKIIPIDVVFPSLHGRNGEDGTIQGLCELCGIPYVGSKVFASAICMDKFYTKLIVDTAGIRQAEYIAFTKREFIDKGSEILKKVRSRIEYPCFVKPSNSGSSIGISKVKNKKELSKAIESAFEYDNKVIIEKAVTGRELEVAILGSGGNDTEASIVGEVKPAAEFYDFDAKYNNSDSKTIVPADIPDEVSDEIRILAVKLFKALGCSGMSRVDFFIEDGTNNIIFNEMNTIPGFTAISMYSMLWEHMGVPISEQIDRLIEIAIEE